MIGSARVIACLECLDWNVFDFRPDDRLFGTWEAME